MLVLDRQNIKDLLDYTLVVDAVENAYRLFASGKVYTPNRSSIEYQGNTLLYMPCFTEDLLGTKFLTLFPENPGKNHPYIHGLMMLYDRTTGKPLAVMDGSLLTAIRTGAAGSVAIRHFAKKDSKKLMVVGAGKQGFYQALFASKTRDLQEIIFVDKHKSLEDPYFVDFRRALQQEHIKVSLIRDASTQLGEVDIVITATTSHTPVLPNDTRLLQGKLFIGIGSYKPNMREYPAALWQVLKKAYIELPYAMEETGDLAEPLAEGRIKDGVVELIGDYLIGPQMIQVSDTESIWFKSVGMSIMDLVSADLFYNLARQKSIGTEVDL